jgi:hypothetical protein
MTHITIERSKLEQALEALGKSIAITMADIDLRHKAITAIKQALAQPAPVQPVAQVHPNHLKPTKDGERWCREVLLYSGNHDGDLLNGENYRVKLYTTPPAAQRQWVGLTDKQMVDAIEPLYQNRATAEMAAKVSMDEFRAIEAKLKEKNNG